MQPELLLEAVVAVLLLVTVIYSVVLHRKLNALRDSQGEMRGVIDDFRNAIGSAEATLQRLRGSGRESVGELGELNLKAAALRDELKVMLDSGDSLAGRLEAAALSAPRPAAAGALAGQGGESFSDMERELISAMREREDAA